MKRWITLMMAAGFALSASADTLELSGGATSITSVNGGDTAVGLVNASGGDLNWDIGETFTMTFDITVTDPDLNLGGGQPTIAFGVGDNSEGLGFGIGQWDANDYLSASIDPSAGGGGSFSVNLLSSGPRVAAVIPDANDLREDGETAGFIFSALRVDTDTYDFSVTWAGANYLWSADAATAGTADTVDTFHELLLRVNESGSTSGNEVAITNLSMTVIPEPATLGLVAFVGAGLLFVRRRFMI